MIIDEIPIGQEPPWDINVIIEVPFGREPVKYEMDKKSGALYVDRVMPHIYALSLQLWIYTAYAF